MPDGRLLIITGERHRSQVLWVGGGPEWGLPRARVGARRGPPPFFTEATLGFTHFGTSLEAWESFPPHRGQWRLSPLLIPPSPPSQLTLAQKTGDSSADSSSSLWLQK